MLSTSSFGSRTLLALATALSRASNESVNLQGALRFVPLLTARLYSDPTPTSIAHCAPRNSFACPQAPPPLAVRHYSDAPRETHTEFSEEEYSTVAEQVMEQLYEVLEALVEDLDVDGGDVEYTQGVLTIKLGKHGTYVLNKQTPNRQIWLSSPVSGPFRYDSSNGRWVSPRDGRDMVKQLEEEMEQLLGVRPHLDI
jgi:frataxin